MICYQCKKSFGVLEKEYKRQTKNGRPEDMFFCGRSCVSAYSNMVSPRKPPKPAWGNQYAKKGDFTYDLRKIKGRALNRGMEYDLDEDHLKELWEKQNGRCVYTGIELEKRKEKATKLPNQASIDRIDSSKGYVKDNIQFIAYSINLAKNDFTEEVFLCFLDQITKIGQ